MSRLAASSILLFDPRLFFVRSIAQTPLRIPLQPSHAIASIFLPRFRNVRDQLRGDYSWKSKWNNTVSYRLCLENSPRNTNEAEFQLISCSWNYLRCSSFQSISRLNTISMQSKLLFEILIVSIGSIQRISKLLLKHLRAFGLIKVSCSRTRPCRVRLLFFEKVCVLHTLSWKYWYSSWVHSW